VCCLALFPNDTFNPMAARPTETDSSWRKVCGAALVVVPALGLIALTWLGMRSAIHAQNRQVEARIEARVTSQAVNFEQDVRSELLEGDRTLHILTAARQADPQHFELNAWRRRAAVLSDLGYDMLLTDENGVVIESTVPELIGTNVATTDYFRGVRQHGGAQPQIFLGSTVPVASKYHWCMEEARRTQLPDGSFAGIIAVAWRVAAIDRIFRQTDLGPDALIALVGLNDGNLRAIDGTARGAQDQPIGQWAMFQALTAAPNNTWVGRSAPDGVLRFHAFRRIPGSDLAVVVGMDYADAFAPAFAWANHAHLFAGGMSALIAALATLLLIGQARQRKWALAHEQAAHTAANARFEYAKAQAEARTAQLQTTLDGTHDGVAMMDPDLCLVEWNGRFPEIAGVPPKMLRMGLAMEDILRAQARSGQFGPVNVEAEVARRVALLRDWGTFTSTERRRFDSRTIELRCSRLPDDSFVLLYSDVTARRQADDALREARTVAESATQAKSRFVAIVSHEIRTPLSALLSALPLLNDGGLPPMQQAVLDRALQSGDALLGLINDILDMSRLEAGQLPLRPAVFGVRNLVEEALQVLHGQAAERGITLALVAAPDMPAELYADPDRLRQVLINLLSNAVRFGHRGVVGLMVRREQDAEGQPVLWLAVRDRGPVIEPEGRARLFLPFSRLEGDGEVTMALGSGLGLAICKQVVSLMGGDAGCDPWMAEDGQSGNEFWVRVPITPLPKSERRPAVPEPPAFRILPRTRILLIEDVLANQLVTAALLRCEGHAVDVAPDTKQALEMLARYPYDLVLMDVFMAGINGYDAARKVRGLLPPAGTVPIVALTAGVAPDDQAQCREAGINRSVSKPVVLPELVQAIADLAWRGLPARDATQRASGLAEVETSVLSPERITELRNSVPGDMLGGMVAECLIDLRTRLPRLRRALEAGDTSALASQAHAMVGMAAGYGMSALEGRLRALTLAASEADVARAATVVAALDTEVAMAADALREALAIEIV